MIKTREQWEALKLRTGAGPRIGDAETLERIHLIETIEALLEVARDAKMALWEMENHVEGQKFGRDSLSPDLKRAYMILREALHPFDRERLDKPNLPDWMTERE